MGMLDKYLPGYNDKIPSQLIDAISYQWDNFPGDKRSDLFVGKMTKNPIALAYYHILESGIASNRMIPMEVKLSVLAIISNRINKRLQTIPRGGRLGLWANEDLKVVIRTDHKFDFRLWLIRANDEEETTIGLYKFSQTKSNNDTVHTDEDYLLREIWTFDSNGKLIRKQEIK